MRLAVQIKELLAGETWLNQLQLIGILIYFASLCYTNLLYLPYLGNKLQVTEFSFLVVFCTLPFIPLNSWCRRVTFLDWVVLVHLSSVLLSLLLYPHLQVLKEAIGTFYLGGCYLLFSRLFYRFQDKFKKLVQTGFELAIYSGLFLAGAAVVLVLFGNGSVLFYPYHNYPYWGDVLRLQGFASSPNLFFSNLSLATIFLFAMDQKKYKVLTISTLFVCLLTLSKGLLLLMGLLLFVTCRQGKGGNLFCTKDLIYLSSIGILYVFLTWFTLRFDTELIRFNQQLNTEQMAPEPILDFNGISLHATTHFALQRASLQLIEDNGMIGCGFGNYKDGVEQLRIEGKYPQKFASYDPHDFYFAQIAELGFTAIVFLLLLPVTLIHTFRGLKFLNPAMRNAFLLSILFMMLESTCIGSLHFRHYWLLLAVLNGYYVVKTERN